MFNALYKNLHIIIIIIKKAEDFFFCSHFEETTETFKGSTKNEHFYREEPKISPGKNRENDFAPDLVVFSLTIFISYDKG